MDVDLTLEEIIKKKKIGGIPASRRITKPKKLQRTTNGNSISARIGFKKYQPVMDARMKIIQKNRANIRDAREKIEKARNGHFARRGITTAKYRNENMKTYNPVATSRHPIVQVPRGYIDYDNMNQMEEEEEYISGQLSRTVKNDLLPFDGCAPPAPRHIDAWTGDQYGKDPFDLYEVPISRPDSSLRRHISRDISPDILRSSLRSHRSPPSSPLPYSRRYIPDHSHLSYEMRTRLQQAPDPHASMGIFANPLSKQQSSNSGYRIVVSNLHTSVTQNDIKELFEDIGELYDARIVRPGVAEVIYKNLKDADKAVDTYHNRQLDGQPMKCLLVNPRSSLKPTHSSIKMSVHNNYNKRLSSSEKTPLEIDIDALHKVLFRRNGNSSKS